MRMRYAGELNCDIDHPMQEGWLEAGLEAAYELPDRHIGAASRNVDAYRYMHEHANLALLGLSLEELDNYYEMAGNPEKLGEYVRWFGRAAMAGLTSIDTENIAETVRYGRSERIELLSDRKGKFKIAVEIGGKRQFGDWNSTGALDNLTRDIPKRIIAINSGSTVRIRNTLAEQMRRYKIEIDELPFVRATLRRRRTLADVMVEGQRLEFFKESSFSTDWASLMEENPDILKNIVTSGRKITSEQAQKLANRLGWYLENEIDKKRAMDENNIFISEVFAPLDAHVVMLRRSDKTID